MESTPDPELPEESPRDDDAAGDDEIGWAELLRNIYLTIDRRTLGFTRILLGAYLILDLVRRKHDWLDMFSNDGILPSHVSLFRPQGDNFSLFHAFATPGELWLLWGFGLCAYLALLVGYKTKVAQIVSLVFVTSMNGRVLATLVGGRIVFERKA